MTVGNEIPPPSAQGAAAEIDPIQRLMGALFAPVRTFISIALRPDILVPLIAILVIGYASTMAVVPRMDFDVLFDQQAEAMKKKSPNMSEADIERMGKIGKSMATVTAYVSPFLGILWLVVIAAVLLFAFRLMGGDGNFKQAFSVTLYAWMPMVLFGIISTIMIVVRGSVDPSTMATIVPSNPAFLVDMKEQPVLFSALAALDVFTIWTVALLVIGFAAVAKFSRAKSAAIVLTLWFVMIVIRLGLAALQGMGAAAS